MSATEKTYFAVSCLIGEVYNGGFDQFFFNSSGAMYGVALDGLFELDAHETAAMLSHAKDLLFGTKPVPVDPSERRRDLQSARPSAELDDLNRRFWKDPEHIDERCRSYALRHGLYPEA